MTLTAVPAPPVPQIVVLPDDFTEIVTPRGTYRPTATLSASRYKVLQRFQMEFGTNLSFRKFVEIQDELWKALNERRDADGAVLLSDLRRGTIMINEGRIAGMEICALFFNLDGEDPTRYHHQTTVVDKVADWEAAGFDPLPFTRRAAYEVPGFVQHYNTLIQALSSPM